MILQRESVSTIQNAPRAATYSFISKSLFRFIGKKFHLSDNFGDYAHLLRTADRQQLGALCVTVRESGSDGRPPAEEAPLATPSIVFPPSRPSSVARSRSLSRPVRVPPRRPSARRPRQSLRPPMKPQITMNRGQWKPSLYIDAFNKIGCSTNV